MSLLRRARPDDAKVFDRSTTHGHEVETAVRAIVEDVRARGDAAGGYAVCVVQRVQ